MTNSTSPNSPFDVTRLMLECWQPSSETNQPQLLAFQISGAKSPPNKSAS